MSSAAQQAKASKEMRKDAPQKAPAFLKWKHSRTTGPPGQSQRREHVPQCCQSAAPHCRSPMPLLSQCNTPGTHNQKWVSYTLTSPCYTSCCTMPTEKVGLILPMPVTSIDTNKTKMLLKLQVTSGNDTGLEYYGNRENANSH